MGRLPGARSEPSRLIVAQGERPARSGATTVINGRSENSVGDALRVLRDEVPDAHFKGVAADVATAEGVRALAAEVPDVDILINNLGICEARPVLEIDHAEWRRYFEVNVLEDASATACASSTRSRPARRPGSTVWAVFPRRVAGRERQADWWR